MERVFKKGWTNRAVTVRACRQPQMCRPPQMYRPPQARFLHQKPYRFLAGAARKEAS